MPRTGITYEQVAQAAENLRADGRRPTLKDVRALLGTGSSNTIQKHIARWREEYPDKTRHPELPATITNAVSQFAERISIVSRGVV